MNHKQKHHSVYCCW